jgi:hypothetical protein
MRRLARIYDPLGVHVCALVFAAVNNKYEVKGRAKIIGGK